MNPNVEGLGPGQKAKVRVAHTSLFMYALKLPATGVA